MARAGAVRDIAQHASTESIQPMLPANTRVNSNIKFQNPKKIINESENNKVKNSRSESYAAAGVDITAGYKAVELMKKHIARTKNEGCLDDVGGFGGCFGLNMGGMEEPVLVSGTDGCGTKVALAILMDKHDTIGIDAVATPSVISSPVPGNLGCRTLTSC